MTRDEAVTQIKNFFAIQKVDTPGLNEKNLGGAAIGEFQIYFEYKPDSGILKCMGLIYSFRDPIKPAILAGFKKEEAEHTADTGGGFVDYQPENKGLYLSRLYTDPVDDETFLGDMDHLLQATRVWGGEVLERVSTRVFHPEEL